MHILIIEDEPATAKRLEKMLHEIDPEVNILTVLDTVEESVSFFKSGKAVDLVFMDIHLADGNSFEIFKQVSVQSPVIFTTAYDQYAIKAFKVNSIDYLLKPIKKEELTSSLEKFRTSLKPEAADYETLINILKQQQQEHLSRIMVRIGQEIRTIDIPEVAYFPIENKSLYAVMKNGKRYLLDFTMDQLEKQLNPKQFFRINRSMIINYDAISKMVSYSKSRIKIELSPPFSKDAITSTDRSGDFKDWLNVKF
ncbi:MAG: LytTR family DNA-binding domain-containing protein [bacterium]|jgi:DNA-binding LytR/AlgR family response regulator